MVVDIRMRTGPKVKGRLRDNNYCVIEFVHESSVNHMLVYQ